MTYVTHKALMQSLSERIKAEHYSLGYRPTDTALCAELYQFSHRADVDPTDASVLMRSLGYAPYEGFPLRFNR